MKYEYVKRGNSWAVYDPHGHKVEQFYNKEDAAKKTCELNGCSYPPKKKTNNL